MYTLDVYSSVTMSIGRVTNLGKTRTVPNSMVEACVFKLPPTHGYPPFIILADTLVQDKSLQMAVLRPMFSPILGGLMRILFTIVGLGTCL